MKIAEGYLTAKYVELPVSTENPLFTNLKLQVSQHLEGDRMKGVTAEISSHVRADVTVDILHRAMCNNCPYRIHNECSGFSLADSQAAAQILVDYMRLNSFADYGMCSPLRSTISSKSGVEKEENWVTNSFDITSVE